MIRLRRRPLPQVEPMIPLINVAFLLMAFFMLIGRMDATAPFTVMPPRSDLGASLPQGGATISVSASGELIDRRPNNRLPNAPTETAF